jgi:hypothetical protein
MPQGPLPPLARPVGAGSSKAKKVPGLHICLAVFLSPLAEYPDGGEGGGGVPKNIQKRNNKNRGQSYFFPGTSAGR